MNLNEPKDLATLLEAFLLASGKPQTLERLYELFEEGERPEPAVFKKAIEVLRKACDGRAVELVEVASGYRLQVREKFAPWVGRLWEERPQRYSRAMLETLALVAYRQPITRGEIEDIRGVAVNSNIVKTLLEREWIRVVGYREVPGKPAMLATTKQFLDHFNLKSLDQLPPLADLRELEPSAEPEPEFVGYAEGEAPVPASLQARADLALAGEEGDDDMAPVAEKVPEETSFSSLLAELDDMEQGLKIDFDDLEPSLHDDEPPESSEQPDMQAENQDSQAPAPAIGAGSIEPARTDLTPYDPVQTALDEEAEAERALQAAIADELNGNY
ncbi:SMC-Scp complex subunit ScpB [Pseudomonas segetis]|uniref:Condensin subunit ScpB n=1 Tax=Pseudomonas segetis TaxID=298908 RepID=A0A239A477_9PSED|nr:SMC-Scp complex subunit ScpB [Pseudomonas segetis]SNR90232.1 condensin subunit ScpB [Pseudomonas segetis]